MWRRLLCAGSVLGRLCSVRKPTITRGISLALALSVLSLLSFSYYVTNYQQHTIRSLPRANVKCHAHPDVKLRSEPRDHGARGALRTETKVLVFVETQYSKSGKLIIALLEANRFPFKIALAGKGLPYLTHADKGKFGVVVFESLNTYLEMETWNRQILDKYCRQFKVGMITFSEAKHDSPPSESLAGMAVTLLSNLALRDYVLNPLSEILRVTRAGEVLAGPLTEDNWTVFSHDNDTSYQALAFASPQMNLFFGRESDQKKHAVVLQDMGVLDGIQRVFFGHGLKIWIHRLLFLDSLSYLSHGKFSISLERYVQIDIDDIFVGKPGIRMKPDDIEALLSAQERLRQSIDGFRFNLGFSGHYYRAGTTEENLGDEMLIKYRNKFWWFGHTWRHYQPHQADTIDPLMEELVKNKQFAKKYDLPVNQSYAVAPHHSGVYPVHEILYDAWKTVWNVRVTSTEEYPHLNPARHRRGFIHRGIKVLPRQTCGLFTHTIWLDKYPGGRDRLEQSIMGGELFQTFVYNPISIFMTHLSNYGNDRLALFTFESVIKYLKCWTNLSFSTAPPLELAQIYFNKFPDEVNPIWQNPCNDQRHFEIWSHKKSCDRLPSFLVIGPQKTGTTALYTFLSMHPAIQSNRRSVETFEEVQFFSTQNYFRGLDWYMDFFPSPNRTSPGYLFEKSANYFDNEHVPLRAHALLPKARIVTLLINPSKRAYSWYQHMRSHRELAALQYTFDEVVTADQRSPKPLRALRERCLFPGLYATHLERWLTHYPAEQLLVLDGDVLKSDPVLVMDRVQKFLQIEPFYDYAEHLKYNPKKGFYCQLLNNDRSKCLGRSKGRQYPPMEATTERYLHNWYKKANVVLSQLLSKLGQPQPDWLREVLAQNT